MFSIYRAPKILAFLQICAFYFLLISSEFKEKTDVFKIRMKIVRLDEL